MAQKKQSSASPLTTLKRNESIGARRAMLEEIFNDLYDDRRNIYVMNFIRGVFFGVGSVLGGTILVGVGVWLLSSFVDLFPVLGDFINNIIRAMQRQ